MNDASDRWLRGALRIDATACLVFAAAISLLLASPDPLAAQLDVPEWVLIAAGLLALSGVPSFWSLSRRKRISPARVWPAIAFNAAWAVLSCLAVVLGWIQPSPLGATVILFQGVLTGVLAELELIGLRRARPPALAG